MLLKNLLTIFGALLFIYSNPSTDLKYDFVSSNQKTEVKKTCSSNPQKQKCPNKCLQYPADTSKNNKSDFTSECPSTSFFLGAIWKINYDTPLTLESQRPRSLSNLHNSLYQEPDSKPPRFLLI